MTSRLLRTGGAVCVPILILLLLVPHTAHTTFELRHTPRN